MQRVFLVCLLCVFSFVLAVSAQSLDDPALSPEDRMRAIREQENRWNMRPEDLLLLEERPPRRREAEPLATGLESMAEMFPVFPGQTSELVLKSGTRITLPPGSLRLPAGASNVRAEVIELRRPEDFAFAGISTEMSNNGRPAILESAGMVRLRFLWNTTEVLLASSARLRMEMEPAAYGSFNVYRRNETGAWDLRGPAEENRRPAECQGECPTVSTLIFDKIDRGGWWNFDEPKEEFTCITGIVQGKPDATVRGMGVYRNWTSYGQPVPEKPGRFVMNVMRGEQAKVVSVLEKTNKAWIGTLPAFRTQDLVTHTKLENGSKCQEIGTLEMKEVPLDTLKEKKRFLDAIGWEG